MAQWNRVWEIRDLRADAEANGDLTPELESAWGLWIAQEVRTAVLGESAGQEDDYALEFVA